MRGFVGRRGRSGAGSVVDGYEFSGEVIEGFLREHRELTGTLDNALVTMIEAATRQWFRLLARAGPGQESLGLPSVAVSDLWRQMFDDRDGYAAFSGAAFGRFVEHRTAAGAGQDISGRSPLSRTLALARRDEGRRPGSLPLVFRVDAAVGVRDGRRYLEDCGGSACSPEPGAVCLAHLPGRQLRPRRPAESRPGPRAVSGRTPH